jgi:hypothetical protein
MDECPSQPGRVEAFLYVDHMQGGEQSDAGNCATVMKWRYPRERRKARCTPIPRIQE